jgi:O-antigen/teichoic acid export membrane protein
MSPVTRTTGAAPPGSERDADADEGRGEGLRRRVARGTVVNTAFLAGVNVLGVLKGFVVAAFLSAGDFGVWGLLLVTLGTLLWLAQIGVDDKYIQQDEEDQELAFHRAFTMQSLLCGLFLGLILVTTPLFALLYGDWRIVAPSYALALAVPALALQTPMWVYYRRMDFVKQRVLQALDPVSSFVVTVALAVAGLGYWALVIGTICGAWGAALVSVRAAPYRLRFRYDRATLGRYAGFSVPVLAGQASGVLIAQVPVTVAQRTLGLAAVGAITLASSISIYASRVDDIVSHAIYPAVCAVKDRADLLFETFSKSNRLAVLWGAPCGVGIALFAGDLVTYVLGEKWRGAVLLIQVFGLIAAANQLGFNWTVFYRARGETRPLAVSATVGMVVCLATTMPLLLLEGIDGYAIGMSAMMVALLVVRRHYLRRIFPAASLLRHSARAILPTVPGTLVVLGLRQFAGGGGAARAAAELALFVVLTIATTFVTERQLMREMVGYLRRPAAAPVSSAS